MIAKWMKMRHNRTEMKALILKRVSLVLLTASLPLLSTCSQNILFYEDTVNDWYKKVKLPDGSILYETTKEVCWTSPRSNANFGYWTASYPWNKKRVIKATGNAVTIYPGYAWDGMTVGSTTVKELKPSLIHDALLHAYSQKAPIKRKQADLAFYDLLGEKKMDSRLVYYPLVRSFGWAFLNKDKSSLIIKRDAKSTKK